MKIGYIYDAVYPWEKGGAQKRVWELARRLADEHDVHLYGMHYWDGPPTIERDGVTLHGVCEPLDLYAGDRRSIRQALSFARHVAGPLRNESFDVIDCQQFPYFPVVVAKAHELLDRSRMVVTWYELWDDYWYDYLGLTGVLGYLTERATLRLPQTIVPISSAIERDLLDAGCTAELATVPNGVDYERIRQVTPADDDWDVVYVGRLAEHKNVGHLLEAVRLLDERGIDVSCAIIGDGPERERLEGLARRLGIERAVTFFGFVESTETVLATVLAADVFVLPSEREGFPNTILEANAAGTPCIVCAYDDNGGTAVVEDGETGFVVPPTPEAIADRIETLEADPALASRLGENARAFGEQHDWGVIVDELEAVYRRATEFDRESARTVGVA